MGQATTGRLSDEDWAAADEALERHPQLGFIEGDIRADLAYKHSVYGPSRFRLYFRLRPPHGKVEEWELDWYLDRISGEEFKRRIHETPVDEELLQTYFDGIEEKLRSYSKFLQLIGAIVNDQRDPDRWVHDEPVVDRHAVAMNTKLPLYTAQLDRIAELVAEARLLHRLRTVTIGDTNGSTAALAAFLAMDSAFELWGKCKEIADRSRTDPDYLYATTASRLFFETHMPNLPRPQELLTQLEEEHTAARLLLCSRPPAPASEPPQSKVSTAEPKRSTNAARKPNLQRWAIGMETQNRWWLFHKVQGLWQQRSRLLIPNGNASRILLALVSAGGCLSREEADRAFDGVYSGQNGRKRSRTYTDALAKVKRAVRQSISKCGEFDLANVPNPIPFEEPGWRAEVEVGIAVLDDNGRLVLNSVAESI